MAGITLHEYLNGPWEQVRGYLIEELDQVAVTLQQVGTGTTGGSTAASGTFPGMITATATSTAPAGWLLCDGSTVSRVLYADLFAAIGTTYGAGDGANTFGLPDLQQRFLLGKAASGTGSTLGSTGGAIDHTHTVTVGNHTHTVNSHTHSGAPHTHTVTAHHHGVSLSTSAAGAHDHTVSGTTSASGDLNHVHYFSASTSTPSADVGFPTGDLSYEYAASNDHYHDVSGWTSGINVSLAHDHTYSATTNTTGTHSHTVGGNTDDTSPTTGGAAYTAESGAASPGTSAAGGFTQTTSGNNPPYVVVQYVIKT